MDQGLLIAFRRFRLCALAILALAWALVPARALAAVTIQSFTAQPQTSAIQVKWTTATELNNSGFNVYRGTSSSGPFTKINSSLIPASSPGSIAGSSYTFTDDGVAKGQTYYYKLESVEFNGSTQNFGPVNTVISSPSPTPTTPAPTSTPTVAPTSTRIPTAVSTATTAPASVSATPATTNTPSAIASKTAIGTVRPTSTPFPTRVALFANPSAPTASLPVSPKSNEPVAAPTTASSADNLIQQNSASGSNETADDSAVDQSPAQSTATSPLLVALALVGGAAVMTAIAFGAASFYLIARKFIR